MKHISGCEGLSTHLFIYLWSHFVFEVISMYDVCSSYIVCTMIYKSSSKSGFTLTFCFEYFLFLLSVKIPWRTIIQTLFLYMKPIDMLVPNGNQNLTDNEFNYIRIICERFMIIYTFCDVFMASIHQQLFFFVFCEWFNEYVYLSANRIESMLWTVNRIPKSKFERKNDKI